MLVIKAAADDDDARKEDNNWELMVLFPSALAARLAGCDKQSEELDSLLPLPLRRGEEVLMGRTRVLSVDVGDSVLVDCEFAITVTVTKITGRRAPGQRHIALTVKARVSDDVQTMPGARGSQSYTMAKFVRSLITGRRIVRKR
jgi:hypothetical protein